MNIVYLVTRLKAGAGPVNQALNLASAMKALGVKFFIVCLSPEIPNASWEDRFKVAGVEIVHLNLKPYDIFGAKAALKKIIRDLKIDIVHSAGLRPDLINVLLGKDIPHISTQRCEPCNIGEDHKGIIRYLMEKIQLRSVNKMDKVVACSKSLKEYFKEHHNIDCDYVQNGVNVDLFKPVDEQTKIQYRKELHLPIDKIIYTYLGVFVERKDITTLLNAFTQDNNGNRMLLLVGGTEDVVQKLRIQFPKENILFVGHQNAPLKYLQCSDFSISASLSEGLPNSVLESVACGVPVVLSDIKPHLEILEHETIGESFHVKDVEGVISAITRIESIDYSLLQNNCLKITQERFSKFVTAKNYIERYKSVISQFNK